jgi:hypothetical protein
VRDAVRQTMSEAEWLACTDPEPMLEFLRGKASDRKLRLFSVACCHRIWHLMADDHSRKAVEIAEQVADGIVPCDALRSTHRDAWEAVPGVSGDQHVSAARAAGRALGPEVYQAGRYTMNEFVELEAEITEEGKSGEPDDEAYWRGKADSERRLAWLLRCIFGNPFRPTTLDPAWLSSDVVSLARKIYDERAFDRMPELADALEGAGCGDTTILNDPTMRRLQDFIAFCEGWHARLDSGEDVDASEFDRFSDVLTSGLWATEARDGTIRAVHEAPVFYDSEVTWNDRPGEAGVGEC